MTRTTQRPTIVCLCGSTRFGDEFARQNLHLTLEGKIVLTIGAITRDRALGIPPDFDVKARLDELHLRKIDLADEVLVLNVGGYIGPSTALEVAYARRQSKRIAYLEPITHPDAEPSSEPVTEAAANPTARDA